MPECSFLCAKVWPRQPRGPIKGSPQSNRCDRQPPGLRSATRPLESAGIANRAARARSGTWTSQNGADRCTGDGGAAARTKKYGETAIGQVGRQPILPTARAGRAGRKMASGGESQACPSAGVISPKPPSTSLASASTAASASGPLARKVSVVPFPAPSVNKSRMLLPLITSFPFTISTWHGNVPASFTNWWAGRAWKPCGFTTVTVRVAVVSKEECRWLGLMIGGQLPIADRPTRFSRSRRGEPRAEQSQSAVENRCTGNTSDE
jgi:hypothetical protein